MAIQNITDRFGDLNPHDRVYSSDSGYTVKIKVVQRETGAADRLCFVVSGSLCDDVTAKALPHGDGFFIVPPLEVTPHAETPTDMAQVVEEARRDMVRRVEMAALNRAAAQALDGVLAA